MKKLLVISRNFPPLVGGMERLVLNIYKQLNNRFYCDLVGPRGSKEYVPGNYKVYECTATPLSAFLVTAMLKSIRAIASSNYSACIAGSGVTAPIALLASRLRRIPCITFIHGLDLIVKNRVYQKVFVPAIRHSDLIIANSANTARLAEEAGVDPNRISILHPGVQLPETAEPGTLFRDRYHLHDKRILLSVGRLIPRKGLAEFISQSLPAIVASQPNTLLAIIGSEPENALQRGDSITKRINDTIRDHRLEDHVLMIGHVDDDILQAAFSESDLFVFPLRAVTDDVEGFGMVAVEAAALGLPSIAFSEGGVSDAVHSGRSGYLITSGDYQSFSQTVIGCLQGTIEPPSPECCREHAARFQWEAFGDKLADIVTSVANKAHADRL
jgi:phosphatidylinositol alpha-1,6-mannosyltransferase